MTTTFASAPVYTQPGFPGLPGDLNYYLATGRTGPIPSLAEVTCQLVGRDQITPPVTNLPGWSETYRNEYGYSIYYLRKDLRAIAVIELALIALVSYLLYAAPGSLLSAPHLWLGGAVAAWVATAWMGFSLPGTRRALRYRRVFMVTGWVSGLIMLLAGIILPVSQWASTLLIS